MERSILSISNFEVCRCENSDYFKYGFSDEHYFKTIGRGAVSYIFYINSETVAFASLMAMPIKGHTNCVIFHRIVVLPKWQHIGLGGFIALFLSGIYKNIGKEVYMKVLSKAMGRWQEKEKGLWTATAMNKRSRKLTQSDSERNHARYRQKAYSHKYIGLGLKGYEQLTTKTAEAREKGLFYNHVKLDIGKIISTLWGIKDIDLLRDCYLSPEDEIISKYGKKYQYFNSSEINDEGASLALPAEHIEIRLRDMSQASHSYCKRVVFINAMLRRKIQPNISLEHLIYCILTDKTLYNLNVKTDEVIRICRQAMWTEIDKFTSIGQHKHKYKVNLQEADIRGLTPRQASNVIRGEITSERIRELYDNGKTDEENIKAFASNGLTISLRTLKRWRKANGLCRYKATK